MTKTEASVARLFPDSNKQALVEALAAEVTQPHDADMTTPTRDEVKAMMAATEAKTAQTLELMRRENVEFREAFNKVVANSQTDQASFRESMRELLGKFEIEAVKLRSDTNVTLAAVNSALGKQTADHGTLRAEIKNESSGLKVWILLGALGTVATLGTIAARMLPTPSWTAAEAAAAERQELPHAASPPPAPGPQEAKNGSVSPDVQPAKQPGPTK